MVSLEPQIQDFFGGRDYCTVVTSVLKEALGKEIEDLKALILALKTKDTELQNQISALQSYVDEEIHETT